MVLTTNGN